MFLVFLLRNGGRLRVALVGLAVAVAGGWWVLTERMPRRAVGMVGLVAGVVLMLVALIRAAANGDQVLLRVAILVVLIALVGWTARAATAPEPAADRTPAAGSPRRTCGGGRSGRC